ncbi:hypothetical protein RAC89_22220 [Paenibacillus sp. GD4]|jgi:hypothetical protein|uniref:hypothetical protein n=1 Tax=Paenibacillus TaxID=44249 RepID=UPI002543A881|nr:MULTISPECIES: hypothetical protein [Paenibacillus]MDQ1913114.1 hypothetical protein [Paenibacillus sp. GD4]
MHSALSQQGVPQTNLTELKLQQILDPDRPLCKEDVVWVLEYIKKKVTEEDPKMTDLSQPRLMQNFRYFAEIALMLIQRRNGFDQEADRLKSWVYEASFGLHPAKASRPRKPLD